MADESNGTGRRFGVVILMATTKQPRREPWRSKIGRELADARRRQLLSLRDLAEICGLPHPDIARIESGRHNFTIDTLEQIAAALELDVALKKNKTKRRPRG
jgi:ribosome-binding protein aMBF1 (putative translation factor)